MSETRREIRLPMGQSGEIRFRASGERFAPCVTVALFGGEVKIDVSRKACEEIRTTMTGLSQSFTCGNTSIMFHKLHAQGVEVGFAVDGVSRFTRDERPGAWDALVDALLTLSRPAVDTYPGGHTVYQDQDEGRLEECCDQGEAPATVPDLMTADQWFACERFDSENIIDLQALQLALHEASEDGITGAEGFRRDVAVIIRRAMYTRKVRANPTRSREDS